MPDQSDTFRAAQELLQYMIARSTGGGDAHKPSYQRARDVVLSDPSGANLAPACVRVCREPDAVWSYVKAQSPPLETYESRRRFFRAEFEPLLSGLERFESSPLDALVAAEVSKLDSASVSAAWQKGVARRTIDPEGAITAARTLLESICKTILDDIPTDAATSYENDDLPALYRRLAKELRMAPTDQSDKELKRILQGCVSVVSGLGALRNRDSDAHGKGRWAYRPADRHAALAVNLAGAMALFLIQTSQGLREHYEQVAREVAEQDDDIPW